MVLVPDFETGGFSFIWTIQNFSYCLQKKGESLSSPRFKLNLSDINEWYLNIYPRSVNKDDTIGIFLVPFLGPYPITLKYCFSIRTTNGTFKRTKVISYVFQTNGGIGHPNVLKHSELFKEGNDAFLENDTLTLRCRIWKVLCLLSPELPVTGQSYALTLIDVKRIAFVWSLKDFKELLHNGQKTIAFDIASYQIVLYPNSQYNMGNPKQKSFTVATFLSGGVYCDRKIQIKITHQSATSRKKFLTCKLSLLDADGKTVQSVRDEYWSEGEYTIPNWHFTFMPVHKILDHEERYLVNGVLSLRCEFAVSSGEKYGEVLETKYGVAEENVKACYSKTVDSDFQGSRKDDMQCLYKEGKFSDLTIRTASGKEFPVHKAILCARSEVFSAMFEHDTKENQTGVVEIKDLNDDTVSKMLLFIYADILEDLEWEAATELYFAADKYGILALKRGCSTFLKGNLKSSNVCHVLCLADMHQDQDMKSAAQVFVMDHATEIINSENWKKLIQDKPNIAAETMHLLYMKNLKI